MDDALLYAAAPGKINLYLKVTGRRENGYHELESLFLPLACPADDVAVDCDMLPGAITVGTSDIMIPGGLQNIAGKAAELWAKKSGTVPHWDINIAKNIPVAAGMGGGSSDAAAVLKLLNDHAGKPLNDIELRNAALELGADVPFFLDARPAIMTGIGEIAEPLEFALSIRIPGFAAAARVNGQAALPGTIHTIRQQWQGKTQICLELEFETVMTRRPADMRCINRGPLLFALPIDAEVTRMEYVVKLFFTEKTGARMC